jgi:hypothetical protein
VAPPGPSGPDSMTNVTHSVRTCLVNQVGCRPPACRHRLPVHHGDGVRVRLLNPMAQPDQPRVGWLDSELSHHERGRWITSRTTNEIQHRSDRNGPRGLSRPLAAGQATPGQLPTAVDSDHPGARTRGELDQRLAQIHAVRSDDRLRCGVAPGALAAVAEAADDQPQLPIVVVVVGVGRSARAGNRPPDPTVARGQDPRLQSGESP